MALLLHFDHEPVQVSRRVRNDDGDVIAMIAAEVEYVEVLERTRPAP